MEPELLRTAQLRQAMYLGFALVQASCSRAVPRFDTRFRSLLHYFRNEEQIIRPEVRELKAEYAELYLTLWQSGPSGRFIPLIIDAMFHEFFRLHKGDNPLEARQRFCEEELTDFMAKYFPEFNQESAAYERLVKICQDLRTEAAELAEAQTYPTPTVQKLEKSFPRLESRSPVFNELIRTAAKAARSRAPILLTGETGTGKEVLARFIHRQSPRARGPFITVNCAAIPENLLESELFGFRKGAFTEARANKQGQLTRAEGGTVFLDEIGEMSPRLQVRLLRFLQEHSVLPLGAVKPIYLDVRILAASNQDLEAAMSLGNFRQDLFYRLNVFHFLLPPLRERAEDVPGLADHFIRKYNRENQTSVSGLSPGALNLLTENKWPGNIRELENVIQRAVVLAGLGEIGLKHLSPGLAESAEKIRPPLFAAAPGVNEKALLESLSEALALPGGSRGLSRRLARSVPLDHMIRFFQNMGSHPFPPRTFADHISPPHWLHRRDKLANQILRALHKADVLGHNGRQAQSARYFLNARFLD
ncbi:MAG: sigma-54-dependent Fis family transcriptional regulator [Deltaproteobacteria bacterium]|nr:sigma-54-dependent Fis family transcriptional regulator [Deltaproteobacteria bacterium]